jgi:hypothetical protein
MRRLKPSDKIVKKDLYENNITNNTSSELKDIPSIINHKKLKNNENYNIESDVINPNTTNDTPEEYINYKAYKKLINNKIDIIQTVGKISGGIVTEGTTPLTARCSQGTGYVKITDNNLEICYTFNFSETDNISLIHDNINYIIVDYNDEKPIVLSTTNFTNIDFSNQFIIGVCNIDIENNFQTMEF